MADLIIRISGNIDDFDKALEQAQGKTEGLSNKLESIAKASAVAFAALTGEVVLATKAFGESQEIQNRLVTAMQNQGVYTKALEKKYDDLAGSLQELTGHDDDAIKSAIAVTQSMIGQQEVTQDLTQAILDLSAGKKMDLESTAELISKGINGQTTALKKQGIEIDDNLSKQERMAKIIEVVTQKYGGQAEAANKGIGAMKGLTSAFGNLQEEIGKRFAPIVERAIKGVTEFLISVQQNQGLMDLAASLLAAGVAVTGLIAWIASIGAALLSASAIASAFGVTLAAALGPIGWVTAAVAALGAGIGYLAAKQITAADGTGGLETKLKDLRAELAKLQAEAAKPGVENQAGWMASLNQAMAKTKAEIADTEERLRKLQSLEGSQKGTEQDRAKEAAAKKAAQEEAAAERRKRERIKAENELNLLVASKGSEDLIALKRGEVDTLKQIEDDKNAGIRSLLAENLVKIRAKEDEAAAVDRERRQVLREQLLTENEEFQQMTAEQQQRFFEETYAQQQNQIAVERTARDLVAKEKLQKQLEENNTFLLNQQKYGTAYATIWRATHTEAFQAAKDGFSQMAALQSSSNSTLKTLGKAGAIASIIISTQEAAMNIYKGFTAIPIIGPALGIAGAAGAIAFGAERIGQVTAAAHGGLITGGIPGVDSVPVLAQQGELVSPAKNFDEVIGSVRAAREAEKFTGRGSAEGGGSGFAELVLSIRDNGDGLMDWIEAKLVERRNLNISLQGA